MKRFFFFILATLFVFFGYPYISLGLSFLYAIHYTKIPYELILIAILADILVKKSLFILAYPLPLYSFIAFLLICFSFFIHKRVTAYV
jgi:hypothetical protein